MSASKVVASTRKLVYRVYGEIVYERSGERQSYHITFRAATKPYLRGRFVVVDGVSIYHQMEKPTLVRMYAAK